MLGLRANGKVTKAHALWLLCVNGNHFLRGRNIKEHGRGQHEARRRNLNPGSSSLLVADEWAREAHAGQQTKVTGNSEMDGK